MFFILDKPGQLCNQLWAYSNMITVAAQLKQTIVILIDDSEFDHIDIQNSTYTLIYKKGSKLYRFWNRIKHSTKSDSKAYRFVNFIFEIKLIKEATTISHLSEGHRFNSLVFINSWENRGLNIYFKKQSKLVRNTFLFCKAITSSVDSLFKLKRKRFTKIIGIHIRKGDYKDWEGGRHFYSFEIYQSFIQQFSKLFPYDNLTFLICSNEDLDCQYFGEISFFQTTTRKTIEDLYALSRCDLLLGPLSTFSMWASFYGNVPLRFINSEEDILQQDEFQIIASQDVFEHS